MPTRLRRKIKKDPLAIAGPLVIRIASLPESFINHLRSEYKSTGQLINQAQYEFLSEAIFIASPKFHESINAAKDSQSSHLVLAVARYGFRMSQRATPFGAFAAIGFAKIGTKTNLSIGDPQNAKRVSGLSGPVLQSLAHQASESAAIILNAHPESLIQLNSTVLQSDYDLKFSEMSPKDKEISYLSSRIVRNITLDYIVNILNDGPVSANLLCNKIMMEYNCHETESLLLISDLLKSKLLVFTDYQFSPFYKNSYPKSDEFKPMIECIRELNKLGNNSLENIGTYSRIIKSIGHYFPNIDPRSMLNVTHVMPNETCTIDRNFVKSIADNIDNILPLLIHQDDNRLVALARYIDERYGSQPVSLVEILEGDQGAVFGRNTRPVDSVIPIMPNQQKSGVINLTITEQKLLKIIFDARTLGNNAIILTDKDLETFGCAAVHANSVGIIGSILEGVQGSDAFELKALSIGSGTEFLGRFARSDPELAEQLSNFRENENKSGDGPIFVDVVHIPSGRDADVVAGPLPNSRYIDVSGGMRHDDVNCIPLRKILISVRNGKLVLSDMDGVEIVPRLPHVHQADMPWSMPAYRFFSVFQESIYGKKRDIWGRLRMLIRWTPRLIYKNIVLSRESWVLDHNDAKSIIQRMQSGEFNLYHPPLIPNKITSIRIVENDNFMIVDLGHKLDRDLFIKQLTKPGLTIIEAVEEKIKTADSRVGNSHSHEIAMTLTREVNKKEAVIVRDSSINLTRTLTSDRWLYYKIFGNEDFLENLLNVIYIELHNDIKNSRILRMFFVRFSDILVGCHFRYRILCATKEDAQNLNILLSEIFERQLRAGLIHKIETSTYFPEFARYGGKNGLEVSEKIFSVDSLYTNELMALSGDISRWKLSIIIIFRLIKSMNLIEKQVLNLLDTIIEKFAVELDLCGSRLANINKEYRIRRYDIANILLGKYDESLGISNIMARRDSELAPLFIDLQDVVSHDLLSILSSHIHMTANRILQQNSRLEEAVILIYIRKFLQTQCAKEGIAAV